jgi:hypothetical protein
MKSQWGSSNNGKFLQAAKDSKMGDYDDTPSAADFTKFCKGIKTSLEERRREFGENPLTCTWRNLGEVLIASDCFQR